MLKRATIYNEIPQQFFRLQKVGLGSEKINMERDLANHLEFYQVKSLVISFCPVINIYCQSIFECDCSHRDIHYINLFNEKKRFKNEKSGHISPALRIADMLPLFFHL